MPNKEETRILMQRAVEENANFGRELKEKKGFIIKPMAMDGNCLFRSVADQIYGDQEMHDQVRERCIDYITAERDHYSQFITEEFEDYVARKRQDRAFGNNTEIQAIGELYNRPIEIYTFDHKGLQVEPINLFHSQYTTDNPPIRLSYHHGNHYNSVVDPYAPTIGVGLGLPNLQPGLADKMQLRQALNESEVDEIDKVMLEKLTTESEMELAQKQLEEAVLLESEQDLEYQILLQSEQRMEEEILQQSRKEYIEQLYQRYNMS